MNPLVSVIICTHNPRAAYIESVLSSLRIQTLAPEKWELLLIDNRSDQPLSERIDISWHPRSRHVREEKLGLTPARFTGIREAAADILVFVDDDNLLDQDYLQYALSLADKMPYVGAFGGDVAGEFEVAPPAWINPYLECLVVRKETAPRWSCQPGALSISTAPAGAGLVVRADVARLYLSKASSDPIRKDLDRKGSSLMSGGDTDMVFCACEMGLAVGLFPELRMRHLISKERLTLEYTLRLARGITVSVYLLRYLWDGIIPSKPSLKPPLAQRITRFLRSIKQFGRFSEEQRVALLVEDARRKGSMDAYEIISNFKTHLKPTV